MYEIVLSIFMMLAGVAWLTWLVIETHKSRNQPPMSWKMPLQNESLDRSGTTSDR